MAALCTLADIAATDYLSIRLLGWWSIDEGSREEQARLYHDASGLVFYFADLNNIV